MGRERFAVAALCVTLGGCATSSSTSTSQEPPPPPSGLASRLPDFELETVDGDSLRLSQHLGREVVVMTFWDTWCEPCKAELPHLDKLYRAHKDQGLLVLAISMDDPSTAMNVAPYVHQSGFAFPVLVDPSSKASSLYNVHKTAPYTVVIARDGKIASESAGFDAASVKPMVERIEALLAAKP